MSKNIGVIGAGSWGTALALTLADNGHAVKMWDINSEHLAEMSEARENRRFLPGIGFPENLQVVPDVKDALSDADVVLFSVPAQHFRSAFESALPYLPAGRPVMNVAKGIDTKSLMLISQIAKELKEDVRFAVLSGPSHAEEVGLRMPTTVVAASDDRKLAEEIQDLFMNENFRIYTNDDVCGVELGGALKNIIALGAGIADGLGYGDNAKAALMSRGMTEISRLGVAMGADPVTFTGLSGIGDLIVTCTSMHSRNRRCGIMIGEGLSPEEATERVGMVVEGIYTTEAAYELAERHGIEMPITKAIYEVIKGKVNPSDAVKALMTRSRKHENENLLKTK